MAKILGNQKVQKTNIEGLRGMVQGLAKVHTEPVYRARKVAPAVTLPEGPTLLTTGMQIAAGEASIDAVENTSFSPFKVADKFKYIMTDASRFKDDDNESIPVAVVGQKMPIIQHAGETDAEGKYHPGPFEKVFDRMEALGITDDLTVEMFESPNRASFNVTWPGMQIIPADGEPIDLGLNISHGFGDKSFSVGGYGVRLICVNGMMLKTIIGIISVQHRGSVKAVLEKIAKFVGELQLKGNQVVEVYNAAMQVEMVSDRDVLVQLLGPKKAGGIGFSDGYAESIADMYIAQGHQTAADLYNDATNIASHSVTARQRTFFAKLDNSATAEDILMLPAVQALVRKPEQAAA
jgi:hypothetical protein